MSKLNLCGFKPDPKPPAPPEPGRLLRLGLLRLLSGPVGPGSGLYFGGGLMDRRRQMKELPPCPRCGMYGGKRMVAQGNTDGFFVLCDSCGYRTKNYTDIAHAVRVWRETQL